MSFADNLVRSLFTILAVGLSYDFEPRLAGYLQSTQPGMSSFGISLEAAAIIVIPTLLLATFIIRQIRSARAVVT